MSKNIHFRNVYIIRNTDNYLGEYICAVDCERDEAFELSDHIMKWSEREISLLPQEIEMYESPDDLRAEIKARKEEVRRR